LPLQIRPEIAIVKLYYSEVVSPRKVCAVAKYLGSPVEYVYLDMARAEHRKPPYTDLNPNGKVPTLVDGGTVLWEADAIMCALAAKAGSELWPGDARQFDIIRWLSWNAQHFYRPGVTLYFEHVIKPRFKLGGADAGAIETAVAEFRRFGAVLDAHLKTRDWLVGDAPTVADFSVAVALPYAGTARLPVDGFAHMQRWHDRLCQLEAWRNPFPVR
jgi:glutathione S-transferase